MIRPVATVITQRVEFFKCAAVILIRKYVKAYLIALKFLCYLIIVALVCYVTINACSCQNSGKFKMLQKSFKKFKKNVLTITIYHFLNY